MTQNHKSIWNAAVIQIVVDKLARRLKRHGLKSMSNDYLVAMISEKFTRARNTWKKAQLRKTADGVYESPEALESRLNTDRRIAHQVSRKNGRRFRVSFQNAN